MATHVFQAVVHKREWVQRGVAWPEGTLSCPQQPAIRVSSELNAFGHWARAGTERPAEWATARHFCHLPGVGHLHGGAAGAVLATESTEIGSIGPPQRYTCEAVPVVGQGEAEVRFYAELAALVVGTEAVAVKEGQRFQNSVHLQEGHAGGEISGEEI